MSAKWRALQHRHRCTYSGLIFPQYFIDSLNLLPSDISSLKFFTELKEFISLNSTYSQVEHVKKLTSSFGELLSCSGDVVVSEVARFYLEILFLENSQPLHKTLVYVLARARDHQSLIGSCLRSLCDEYGVLGSKGKRFSVCRVALSLMSCPKLGFLIEIVEECSVSIALDVAFGINAVVSETEGGYRPSPIVMEQCQEALSCLYYLLQRFPSRFSDPVGCQSSLIPEGSTIFEIVMKSIIRILKSPAFSRDCWVAAGVSFCAALQAYMNPQELALFLVKVFYHQISCSISGYENEFRSSDSGLPYKGNLCSEIEEFSVLSRLCLLRGILTAIPRVVLNTQFILSKDSLEDLNFHGNRNDLIWTILFDGILSELCSYCEDPIDSHFNFHVLTVLQICFQQIKTSILAGLVNWSENYDPLPENMGTRILRIIWNNLEDPLSQTVKQVHLIFDLLLDIQSTLPLAEGSEGRKSFLRKTAGDLLRLGGRCKGRYVPLAAVAKRLGAKTLLDMGPNLLFETVHAYVDDDVCCAATSFLKCFLECLRDECWSNYGVERGYAIFRGHCLPPVLYGLVSGVSKLRSNLNTYALPILLEVDVDSIFAMLAFISVGCGDKTEMFNPELSGGVKDLMVDQKVAALVSLMKVSRLLALIEGDIDWYRESSVLQEEDGLETEGCDLFAFVCIKGRKVKIIVEWLVLALTHVDETLRIDAAESLFLNAKTSTLPSALELNLMKEAVPLNMRCSSTGFQMKWTSLFRKFFARAKTALERQFKEGRWKPLACSDNYKVDQDKGNRENIVDRAQNLFCFMKWLSSFLFFSCYPSAPYERKIMAMELILIMINVWSIIPNSQGMCSSISPATCLYPYSEGFTLPDSTLLLVGSIVDSWDRLRECSFRILLNFPTPLPGISSQGTVKEVITWAKRLVCSPRVRESDAGALTLRLIFRKYVLELGWTVGAFVNVVPHNSQYKLINGDTPICRLKFPVIDYILSLIDWLHIAVEEGEKDLSEACKNSFVHGILLTLRYTFDELDWSSNIVLSSSSGMKVALDKLLELIMRITSLALWVVSADAWCLPEDLDDVVDETFLSDEPIEIDVDMSSPELQVDNSKIVDNVKQSEQVVMVGSWLAMKEVSLLLGTIIRKIPLPSCASSDSTKHGGPVCEDVPLVTTSDAMLDIIQLQKIGNHFLEILLKMKHNGAIDKTRAGFTALCNRLLCSNDPRLCKMTESWMEQLMERTVAKGQTVDDLLRRSAGIPAAFIALFLSEPEGTPKKLLPRALKWLIDVANMSLTNSMRANSQQAQYNDLHVNFVKLDQAFCAPPVLVDGSEKNSKIRDEGVIPMVHAFNVLRASFNDTNLAADTSGFCAEALIVSIRSFSSQYWEVRNSACLAYTALVRRMIGFLNVHKRESARRALTGLEFFHRYPVLHPFLFNELKIATEFLGDGSSEHSGSNIAKVVHPSLCPVLILLSRLKPSPLSSENEDGLDPFLFMPFIRRCSTQSNLRVRVLASRALTGLVSNEKLPNALLNIANELPCTRQMASSSISTSSINRIDGIHVASFNSIHGMLLQLSSLLDNNCRNLSDVSKKGRILADLIQVLMTCSWIGNPRLCPCPILNCSFLQVLDQMLSVVRTCRSEHYGSIRSLLLESSLQCLDAEVSCGTPFYDPTKVELRRQAAVSYFNCIFQSSTDAGDDLHMKPQRCYSPALDSFKAPEIGNAATVLQERLILSLSDPSYEVRLATLKWLLKFLKSTGSGVTNGLSDIDAYIVHHWSNTYLQPSLMQILAVEENPKCTYYILRILFSWNLLQFQKSGDQCMGTIYVGAMDYDTIFEFWNNLLSLNKCARHLKTRETVLCCMGICVKQFSCLFKSSFPFDLEKKTIDSSLLHQPEKCVRILGCINSFIILIKKHSSSSEPVNMRKAAAESIVASGLLAESEYVGSFVSNTQIPSEEKCPYFDPSEAADTYACGILDLWFTCIRLLEDEDVGLRQSLAEDVQRCFTLKASGRSQQNGVVPTQVEKVIEASFEFLSSIFGHWIVYFNYLSNLVLDNASCTLTRGDLVRRVFDKEIDNHHEEKLLICQICCFHLEKLPISKSWVVNVDNKKEVIIFLQKRRLRFYHQLVSFSGDYVGVHDSVDWIGGMGNHKDTFISLYANLLGLYALSQCLFNEEAEIGVPLLPDLVELGGTIRPFVRNPLISNLYSLVIHLHERKLGIVEPFSDESRGDSFIWEGFDPYFLLR